MYDNVHNQHIIHAVLMVNLLVFKEKIEKNNLLIVIMVELVTIVLVQHKKMHNLMKYKLIHYVHHTMHIQQLNLILFECVINYNLEVLKGDTIVQSMHVLATKFGLIYFKIEEKRKEKKKEKQKQQQQQSQHQQQAHQNFLKLY